jgi:Sec-independent protein translocase protein TatA
VFQNIGVTEIGIIVLVLIVLFFGKRIADLIRGTGKGIEEYRSAKKDSNEE